MRLAVPAEHSRALSISRRERRIALIYCLALYIIGDGVRDAFDPTTVD